MPLGPGAGSVISGNARLIAAGRVLEKLSWPAHLAPRPPGSRASPGRVNAGLAQPQQQDGDTVPHSGTSQSQRQRPVAGVGLHPDICGKQAGLL